LEINPLEKFFGLVKSIILSTKIPKIKFVSVDTSAANI
jgi:hypothetical protein